MKILFLSRWYPFPPNNGSKLRIYNLLHGLAKQHQVTLLSFAAETEINADMEKPSPPLEEIRVIPWRPFNPNSQLSRVGFFSTTPRAYIDTYSQELADNLLHMLDATKYDLVIASQIDMAAYGRYFGHLPSIFEEAEVGVLYDQYRKATSPLKKLRFWLTWMKHKRFLTSTLKNFDACTVVSQQEQDLLGNAVSEHPPFHIIPNGVDLSSYKDVEETPQPDSIIFTGSLTYNPNYEAMQWFTGEVLPLIHQELPQAHLTITGDHQGRTLPTNSQIQLTGFVDDIRPLIARSRCSVVPILSGGGTRLKILEAMALGTPVVATTKGAEGLDLTNGEHILIANSPDDFAAAVVSLLKSRDLNRKLASSAYRKVSETYDWPVIMPHFIGLIEKTARNN